MKYYLLETYSPELEFEDRAIIVALTPVASYRLDKAGINYSIIEEFYDETEIVEQQEVFLANQIKWFNDFDEFLLTIYPEARIKNLRLATVFFYYIKYMIDAVILRSRMLDCFIRKAKPENITYISIDYKKNTLNVDWPIFCFLSTFLISPLNPSLYSLLIPILCKKYDIAYHFLILKDRSQFKNNTFIPFRKFAKYFKLNNYRRRIFGDNFLRRRGNSAYKLLFLNDGYNIIEIINKCWLSGCEIFLRAGSNIKIKGKRHNRLVTEIKPEVKKEEVITYKNFLTKLYESDVLKWINNQCGADVRTVIMSKLKFYITIFFPQFISLIDKYSLLYDDYKIDMVFTSQRASVEEYAAIAACKFSKNTKSAYLQQGDLAFDLNWIDFGEYFPSFDIYFTTNIEMEKYTRERISAMGASTRVFQNPTRYSIIRRAKKNNKKTVVFVPTMYKWDLLIWINSRVPDAWYFSWHKKLLDYFSLRTDLNFIWKAIPKSNQTYDPIPDLLKDKNYTNIKYATEPFIYWLRKEPMVLLDYPSTALYEAAISGVPVMCLFFAPFNRVRKTALGLFGKSLQPFYNFEEGIAKIDNFLNSEPQEFTVSLPISHKSILQVIDSFMIKKDSIQSNHIQEYKNVPMPDFLHREKHNF